MSESLAEAREQILAFFRERGATDARQAVGYEPVRLALKRAFARLRADGIIVQPLPDTESFYLDEDSLARAPSRRAWRIGGTVVAVGIAALISARLFRKR
jgi:hypothetical protein